MQLRIDRHKYPIVVSQVIPDIYSKLALENHSPEVIEGNFGIMINQWMFKPEYKVCVGYFAFSRPVSLFAKSTVKCTAIFIPVKNAPAIVKQESFLTYDLKLKENEVTQLHYEDISIAPQIKFGEGTYLCLSISVFSDPNRNFQHDPWLDQLLSQYNGMLQHLLGTQDV